MNKIDRYSYIWKAIQKHGYKTGILDADIHGPNIPKMLGVEKGIIGLDENNSSTDIPTLKSVQMRGHIKLLA